VGATCRSEILEAMRSLQSRHGRTTFDLSEIVQEVFANGSTHAESSIRTHVASSMCVNAPTNHVVTYNDLERVGRGQYRLLG